MNVRKCDTMRLSRPLRRGFTLVEILTVMAIIALLMGLLVPSFTAVRRFANDTKQRAEFASIEAALMTFRNDYGDYPESEAEAMMGDDYCGAQKLTEALLGRDLLGFHPQSDWRLDDGVYDSTQANIDQRRGRYLDLTHINVFRLGDLFNASAFPEVAVYMQDTFVLCDVYGKVDVYLSDGRRVRAGAPILYYRANRSRRVIDEIYHYGDNVTIMGLDRMTDGQQHAIVPPADFYDYIADPRVSDAQADPPVLYPYRPDSYLLISAGADGLYGTADDIRNF